MNTYVRYLSKFKCPGLWDEFDLDSTFGKGDQLFNFLWQI